VPAAAKAHRESGVKAASRSALRYSLQGACLLLPYYALLLTGPRLALSVFYGHSSSYRALGTALRIFVLAYLVGYLFFVAGSLFNALARPSLVLLAELGGAGAALALGLPIAARYGIIGACAGFLLVASARVLMASFFVWNLPGLRKTEQALNGEVPLVQKGASN
jgi:O-antigen/teichoic acid export membrane protein